MGDANRSGLTTGPGHTEPQGGGGGGGRQRGGECLKEGQDLGAGEELSEQPP